MTEPLTPSTLADAFRKVAELHSKPMATAIKAGQKAWPKVKERLSVAPANPEPPWMPREMDLFGIPVCVLEPSAWPPNLVAIVDQEGNAMSAWIIND